MLKSIHHVAIICSDYEKSKHFYTQILKLQIVAENYREQRDSYKLDLQLPDGGQIELFSFANPPQRINYPEAAGLRHLAFAVDCVESCKEYLIQQGIKVEDIRLDHLTNRKFTFFNDPDGLPLELYQKLA